MLLSRSLPSTASPLPRDSKPSRLPQRKSSSRFGPWLPRAGDCSRETGKITTPPCNASTCRRSCKEGLQSTSPSAPRIPSPLSWSCQIVDCTSKIPVTATSMAAARRRKFQIARCCNQRV
ncbi:hypothetical protein V8G54_031107 [Vigna mungo]|uniref:Uncharacterized protein n=1 Tax=Vigna mungo TaxID=3915 RepID=A0AAQ3MXQ7_VIGMU